MWQNKRLLLIYAIVLVDIVAGSIVWPVWPQFVKGYTHPELLLAIGTAIFIGLQLFTAPLLGSISDRKGRKPVFMITAVGTFLSNLLLIPRNAFAYFSNRGTDGLTNGVYAAVRSSITDISDEKDLLRNMGLEGTIVSLGFILGPLIASLILLGFNVVDKQIVPTLIYTGIAISAINILLSYLFKETLLLKRSRAPVDWRNTFKASLHLISHFKRIITLDKSRPGLLNTVILQICLVLSLGYYNYLITYISLGSLQMTPKEIS
ncbi:MAG: MFS transporter [Thermonemataceae bacterium]